MNLKKIKDNKKKVRDGKLKNLALAGMMGLAGITGMNSCGDDPLEEEPTEQGTGDQGSDDNQGGNGSGESGQGGESNQNGENNQGGDANQGGKQQVTPAPTTGDTVNTMSAPRYLEDWENYNGYKIKWSKDNRVPVGVVTCPDKNKALYLKSHLPAGVTFIPENSKDNVVHLSKDKETERNWDDILKLMK